MVKRDKLPSKAMLAKASKVLKDPKATAAEKSLAGRVLGDSIPKPKPKGKK